MRVEFEGPPETLKIDGDIILSVHVEKDVLVCTWAEECQKWDEFHKSEELLKFSEKAQSILTPNGKGGKGKSKGKKI